MAKALANSTSLFGFISILIDSIDIIIYFIIISQLGIIIGDSFFIGTHIVMIAVLFSTFFTSIWIYLHLLSSFILRLKKPVLLSFNLIKRLIDIKEKPFLSIGAVINVLISLGFLLGLPFVFL